MAVTARKGPLSYFQYWQVLKYRDFRIYWLGMVATVTGLVVMQVGQAWIIYELTGSAAYLGFLGLATALPTIILNLAGGVIADRINPRAMLICTQTATAMCSVALAVLAVLHMVQVWHILAGAVVYGAFSAFDGPARMAMFPRLIDRSQMMNAVALNSTIWNGSRIVGPMIAGLLIAWVGVASCFFFAMASSLLMAVAMVSICLAPLPKRLSAPVLQQLRDGFAFVGSNRLFLSLMGMTFVNSVFGISYVSLLPVFARDILHVGPQGFGHLQTAAGVGALLMSFIAPALSRVRVRGMLILGGAAFFGCVLIAFAHSTVYELSLALLFFVGLSGALYQILTLTTIQILVPDHLRGRVMGLWGMTWGLMPLGGVQSGFIADWMGAPIALTVGGFVVTAFSLLLAVTSKAVRGLRGTPQKPVESTTSGS